MMPDSIFLLNAHPSPFWFKEKQIPNMTEYTRKRPEEEWADEERDGELLIRFAFYMYKDEPDVLYLSNVFVEEGSRNRGLGTLILKSADSVVKAIGATKIRLKVKQSYWVNKWYRKKGYSYLSSEDGYDWLEKKKEE